MNWCIFNQEPFKMKCLLYITYEHTSYEYHFKRNFQTKIYPFEKYEE